MNGLVLSTLLLCVQIANAQKADSLSSLKDYGYHGKEVKQEIRKGIPAPSAKQLAFQDLELGLFIHFGLSTYTGQISGDGKHPPSLFNPTNINCDQWMQVAENMGAKYVVLTVRHEGGFCLWPTATTDYSVKNSPWENGKGDVVKEFVTAARKHGLKVGFYISSWHDANQFDFNNDHYFKDKPEALEKFTRLQLAQLTELLTLYGPIDLLWFDHHGCPGSGSAQFWPRIDELVAALQPGCMRLGPDFWVNNTARLGEANDPLWYGINTGDGTIHSRPVVADANHGNPHGQYFMDWEAQIPFSGNWFYNGPGVVPVDTMIARYYESIGRGANLIANFAPDKRGLMPDKVVASALEFGNAIRKRFGQKIKGVSGGKTLLLDLGKKIPIENIVLMEDLKEGQKVAAFEIAVKKGTGWQTIYKGQTIGHKRIVPVNVEADEVRFICTKAVGDGVKISEFAVF